jgi:hypothetical protein
LLGQAGGLMISFVQQLFVSAMLIFMHNQTHFHVSHSLGCAYIFPTSMESRDCTNEEEGSVPMLAIS